jgi:hypothetical protein
LLEELCFGIGAMLPFCNVDRQDGGAYRSSGYLTSSNARECV